MDRHLGMTPNEIDKMAKIECVGENRHIQELDTIETAVPTKRRLANTSSGGYKLGQSLTCFACILFVVLIQLVDCRHHDQKNVISSLILTIEHISLHCTAL